jgi:preprotein translocase subunit SecY
MSEQGVGNGISLIITAGIVSQLPGILGTLISLITTDADGIVLFGRQLPVSGAGLELTAILTAIAIATTYFVIKLNEAQRVIRISYAKRVRGNRAYGGIDSVLPLKLITVGVIPIIFAVAFLSVPAFVGQILVSTDGATMQHLGQNLINWFSQSSGLSVAETGGVALNSLIYPAVYFGLVVLFTYFYTSIMFNPKELAENLQKQGGFVAGIRPGAHTEKYLGRIVNRLTLFGSVSLGLVAISPFIIDFIVIERYGITLSQQLTIGGTGLLILVSVAIETLRQIESRALMVSYDNDSSITS